MVLLIALIPALAVLITYYITDSKAKTTVAALIAAAIGVFTGNPIYALLDIAFVAGAYWIAMSNLNDDEKARLETVARLRRVEEMERNRDGTDLIGDPASGWEDRCAAMDKAIAERRAASKANAAALLASMEAERDSSTAADEGWEERCAQMDAARKERVAANKAKAAALLAQFEAERDASAAASAQRAAIQARVNALVNTPANSQRRSAHLAQMEAERLAPEGVTTIQEKRDQRNTR